MGNNRKRMADSGYFPSAERIPQVHPSGHGRTGGNHHSIERAARDTHIAKGRD